MKTIIHVDQRIMRNNVKTGANDPPITIRTYKETKKVRSVKVNGGRFVYSPCNPLSCGARLWFETNEPVTILEK